MSVSCCKCLMYPPTTWETNQQVPINMFLHMNQSNNDYVRRQSGSPASRVIGLIAGIAAFARPLFAPFVVFEHSGRHQTHRILADHDWRFIPALSSLEYGGRACG